jgi:hypothetical protein
VLFPFRIKLEDVERVLRLNFIVQTEAMSDLIFFLHQIELLLNGWVILVPILAHLEEHLDHILHTLVDIGLMKDVSELVKHRECNGRVHFFQVLANFSGKPDCDFHTIVRGLVKEKQQNLSSQHLVSNLVVAQVSDESRGRNADGFVVSLERFAELDDQSGQQQVSDLRKFRVDNRRHRSVDRCKGQTGRLRLHDGTAEQAPSSNQVFSKQLGNDELDVGDVDLVDQTIDRLFQSLPCHTLVLLARLIRNLRLQCTESGRGNVCTT